MGYTSQNLRRRKAAAAAAVAPPPHPHAPVPAPPLDAFALHAELQAAKARIVELEAELAELKAPPARGPQPVILTEPQKSKGRGRRSR
jgi:hypothetical protein